jgi:hypothetical protein
MKPEVFLRRRPGCRKRAVIVNKAFEALDAATKPGGAQGCGGRRSARSGIEKTSSDSQVKLKTNGVTCRHCAQDHFNEVGDVMLKEWLEKPAPRAVIDMTATRILKHDGWKSARCPVQQRAAAPGRAVSE